MTSASQESHGHVGEESPQSNPTDNSKTHSKTDVNKKYSINIDDSLFDALEETYSEQEQGDASIEIR